MKTIPTIICAVFPLLAVSQKLSDESKKFLSEHLNSTQTERVELKAKYKKYDYSKVWLFDQDRMLGFIGNNYQRLYIRFLEIRRNPKNPFVYEVQGKSRVKDHVNDFTGQIRIMHVREIDAKERARDLIRVIKYNDEDFRETSKYARYMILAEYVFREDSLQKYSGEFRGILKSTFFIRNDSIQFDEIYRLESDSYNNNQFAGSWRMYKKGIVKLCCFGFDRIPYSGDLDIGASEFSPDKKYFKYGWESYSEAMFKADKDAMKEEKRVWWE